MYKRIQWTKFKKGFGPYDRQPRKNLHTAFTCVRVCVYVCACVCVCARARVCLKGLQMVEDSASNLFSNLREHGLISLLWAKWFDQQIGNQAKRVGRVDTVTVHPVNQFLQQLSPPREIRDLMNNEESLSACPFLCPSQRHDSAEPTETKPGVKVPWDTRVVCTGNASVAH